MSVKRIFLFIIIIACLFSLFSGVVAQAASVGVVDGEITVDDGKVTLKGPSNISNQSDAMAQVITKYKDVILFVSGILAATSVVIFIVYFLKLGTISSNPRDRKEALTGLLISGVSAALMGSVTLIVGLFYGLLQ